MDFGHFLGKLPAWPEFRIIATSEPSEALRLIPRDSFGLMVRIPTKVPGMVRQGGAAGCFGFGASGSLRIFWGVDFGHFLVNHRQKSRSAPSRLAPM